MSELNELKASAYDAMVQVEQWKRKIAHLKPEELQAIDQVYAWNAKLVNINLNIANYKAPEEQLENNEIDDNE